MSFPIIDCHAHVYPDKIARKAVESIGRFYGIPMVLDGTVDTLLKTASENGVDRCLVHSVAVDEAHVTSVNNFLIDTVRANPRRLMGFLTLHPDMENPEKEIDRAMAAGLLGVKLHPDMQRFALDDPRADGIFAACEGVCPVLVHTGDKRYSYSNPGRAPAVMKRHPRLKMICAHLGGYSEWDDAAKALAGLGVYVDTSSSLFALSKERARALIDLYGADRVLFGSDYPMWNVGEEIERVRGLGLDEETLRKIFSGNLLTLLGIK